MSLLNMLSVPDDQVKDESFYVLMETHVPYLRVHEDTQYVEVTRQVAAKFKGDFHGLLNSLSVSKKFHYLVTRVNNLYKSQEYDGLRTGFYIPASGVLGDIMATYSSKES